MNTAINWNDLQYFVILVKAQTLSASAALLDVQHATVSRRIESLEMALNVKLFDRMGKRYVLTEEGKLLYTQACDVENSVHTFSRMAIEQNAMQGTVTVSAPPVLANELIMPAMPQLHQKHPDICLSLLGDMHYSNLYQREADIAIRIGRPTQEDLVVRKLTDMSYCFYAHKNHRITERIHLVAFHANQRLANWSKQVLAQHKTIEVFNSNDLYIIKNAICQGIGIGVLPCLMVKPTDNLHAIDPAHHLSKQPPAVQIMSKKTEELYLVMHADVRRSARVRAVADWIGSVFI